MSLEPLEIIEECIVRVDLDKIRIPRGLELSLGDDHMIRLGNTPLVHTNPHNARAEYERIKSAFETGKYKLTITPDYDPELEILE